VSEVLNRKVQWFYGSGAMPGRKGTVIGYCEAPQVLIQPDDGGDNFWWRLDLTKDITCPECHGTGVSSD
jgi:hypothetical protein